MLWSIVSNVADKSNNDSKQAFFFQHHLKYRSPPLKERFQYSEMIYMLIEIFHLSHCGKYVTTAFLRQSLPVFLIQKTDWTQVENYFDSDNQGQSFLKAIGHLTRRQ